jgi:flagellar export protein FliJ
MKKFQFRFESVLMVRKRREEESLLSLAATQRAYQEEIAKKNHLISELKVGLGRREKLGHVPTPIAAFLAEDDYIVGTKQRIIQADQAIFRAHRWVEKALRAYLHARTQTKALETLYAQEYADFKKAAQKKEQKDQDDLNLMRFRINKERAAG